ncbi:hypothetical protein DFA_07289 [Cavenderia fasciculata]|uniref:Uncharacterized protein n=1 Tax=Cavenderia fasciculata TaxID=261658 RepID=F4PW05_CACFS|nr:uncharacterized protein DFA_07289 [Cavenderia fasciculata]EGG20169.1 hypothetical protein DFA_07289 [Cavenderia fasciculata]|eukprot:XP_004367152.1 hypothetical protein DFA_07289 [Cavenderia fasciculata]
MNAKLIIFALFALFAFAAAQNTTTGNSTGTGTPTGNSTGTGNTTTGETTTGTGASIAAPFLGLIALVLALIA